MTTSSGTSYSIRHRAQSRFTSISALIFIGLSLTLFASLMNSHTAMASAWSAGKIIDDIVFTNSNSMSAANIQNFLNSKVPACDTQGTQPSEHGGGTRAQWAQARYGQSTFTCIKDYVEGGKSAAQIIYDKSRQYSINPQVLIVLLQKEQGLITDTWPLNIQYRTATGYGCPDTAPCDTQYFGLTNQLDWAAKMFRSIMNASPSWYTPYILGNNFIRYSPIASCGGSNVNIENRSTQALYNYTPYQPNQGALNAGWGTAPCGAYGNRNFWLYFNDWFGPTTNSNLFYSVIKSPDSSALYLQTPQGKHWIPSGDILQAWGLDTVTVKLFPQSYLDSIPTKPELGRLLKDDWGNLFFVDNKETHYIRSGSYLSLYDINPDSAAQSLGLVYTMQSGTWVGRFARDAAQPNGQIWLIDNGQKRSVPSSDLLYQWGYTQDQLLLASSTYLNSLPTGQNVGRYASTGSDSYVVDMNRLLGFSNENVKHAFFGSQTSSSYSATALSFLPKVTTSPFVQDQNGSWFMLESDKKHYIPSGSLAALWGQQGTPTAVSSAYIASKTDGDTLSHVVQTTSPTRYWVVSGAKHYIPDSNTANAWIAPDRPLPTYSTQSLDLLPTGANATTMIHGGGSPYTYTMDAGSKRYLSTPQSLNAWNSPVMEVDNRLVGAIPEGSFVNYLIKDSNGNGYLLMDGTAYPINPTFYDSWGITAQTPVVSDITLARFIISEDTLGALVTIDGITSIMTNPGIITPITSHADAYKPNSLPKTSLPRQYFSQTSPASYLVQSIDANDARLWLINQGKKREITFPEALSFGYLSRGVVPTKLSPATLALIPASSDTTSLLIQKTGSGIKFLDFGTAKGFPNGDTLTSYSNMGVLIVADSIFDSIPLTSSTSKLVRDDSGKIYLITNGQKRWLSTANAYAPYQHIPVTYLYGTTMASIPSGTALN